MIPFLHPSDQIRILSPSGCIAPEYIDGAKALLESWELKVSEGKFARGNYGRFAGTKEERISDLQQAFDDPAVKAILCSRGGYGLAQIVDKLNFSKFMEHPKWLIGFSDITVLHNALSLKGMPSIHGIMAKHLTELPPTNEAVLRLKEILFGKMPTYNIGTHPLNKTGKAKGKLIGGNFSVFMGLRGSSFDLQPEGAILFIEDVGEKPYHIDRMMQNLRISGFLQKLSGLVVGQFSDYDEDPLMHQTLYEIIAESVSEYNYPVCFNFPAGHVDYNLPLVLGKEIELGVSKKSAIVKY